MLTLLETLSLASHTDAQEDEIPQVGLSHPISQPEANLETAESPRGRSIFLKWLQKKSNGGSVLPKPDRLSGKSRQPADCPSPSDTSPRVDLTNEGPSWMAAGRCKAVSALP